MTADLQNKKVCSPSEVNLLALLQQMGERQS